MIVVDSSALVAILRNEPEKHRLLRTITDAKDVVISAATLLEASIAMHRRAGDAAVERLDRLLQTARVRCVAIDETQALAARDAWARYGKGNSPAKLNFGDCFSYALAKTTDRPLLFKGEDFARTDVVPAA